MVAFVLRFDKLIGPRKKTSMLKNCNPMAEEKSLTFDELSNMLALRALQNIGVPEFTVSAMLDVAKPETLANFKIFGDELAKAYQAGAMSQSGLSDADFAEAHEHEAARACAEAEGSLRDPGWSESPVVVVDDALLASLARQLK